MRFKYESLIKCASASTAKSAAAPTSSASSPTGRPLIRLVGAVLAEQHDEWIESRHYLGLDVLSRSRLTLITTDNAEEATPEIGALSA